MRLEEMMSSFQGKYICIHDVIKDPDNIIYEAKILRVFDTLQIAKENKPIIKDYRRKYKDFDIIYGDYQDYVRTRKKRKIMRTFLTFHSTEKYDITRIDFMDCTGNAVITIRSYAELLKQLPQIKAWRQQYTSYDDYQYVGAEEDRVCVAFGDKTLTSKIRIVCGNLTDTLEHVADDISFRIFYEWEQYSLNCRAGELCIGLGYRHVKKKDEIMSENVFVFENHWNTASIFIPTQFGIEGLLKEWDNNDE